MMIDMHTHMRAGGDYAKRLVDAEKAIGVDRFVTFGAGPGGDWASNDEILKIAEQFPEVIPFAYVPLGHVTPDGLTALAKRGMKGFKCINPTRPYNDDSFLPVYARMEELGLPVYFHTGIVGRFDAGRDLDIDTYRNKVIFLDRIVRRFPDLTVIAAHLGNPDYGEAGMMMRWHPNLYFDLSGSTLKKKKPPFFEELFWWHAPQPTGGKRVLGSYSNDPYGRGPWEKIVFGSDVDPEKVAELKADYDRLFDALALSDDLRASIFGGAAARLLGFEKPWTPVNR